MLRLALIGSIAALVVAAAAAAATPPQYRAKVNGICRSYTPQMRAVTNQPGALPKLLQLGLAQDRKIEAVPVPAALQKTMKPIIARLKLIDVQAAAGIKAAANADEETLLNASAAITKLSKPLDKWFDAAGLSDCGSKQS